MRPDDLQEVLRLHSLWLADDPAGKRADLQGANLIRADMSGFSLIGANLSGAALRGANLSGAALRGANLRNADLRNANLSGTDMGGSSLSGANLGGAKLSGSNLRGAFLNGADLRNASLIRADLRGAALRGANLSGAVLRSVDLRGAALRNANLRGALGLPIVADAPARLQAVAARVLGQPSSLCMTTWHGECGTAHCLAGWAIHQAGPLGAQLEALHGPHLAGLMLLGHDAADRFHQSDAEVLEWLRTISEVQP